MNRSSSSLADPHKSRPRRGANFNPSGDPRSSDGVFAFDGRGDRIHGDRRRHDGLSVLFGAGIHRLLGPGTYYHPRYNRYTYCRPYVDYYTRCHSYPYDGYGSGFYGQVGFGYTPYYGYYGRQHYYYPYDYPTNYYSSSYTTVYEADPYVQRSYEAEPYYDSDVAPLEPREPYGPPALESNATTPEPASPDAAIGPSDEEPTLVDLGNAAFNAGEYEEAMRFYVSAVLNDSDDGFARLFYGLAQFALGDYEIATLAMRRALAVTPDLIEYPIDLRSIYPDLETFEKHRKNLAQYVSDHPADRDGLFLLGYVFYASAQPDNAVAILRTLTAIDPSDELAVRVRDAAATVLRNAPSKP